MEIITKDGERYVLGTCDNISIKTTHRVVDTESSGGIVDLTRAIFITMSRRCEMTHDQIVMYTEIRTFRLYRHSTGPDVVEHISFQIDVRARARAQLI